MLKHAVAAMLLLFTAVRGTASNEWNDSVIGWVASRPDGVILAYKVGCPAAIAAKIPKKYRQSLQYSRFYTGKTLINGCWMPAENKIVFIWEDGVYGWLNQSEFRTLYVT